MARGSTPSERNIMSLRRSADRGWVLVPILEKLLEREVFFDDQEDIEFFERLIRARMQPREKGVFSPSMLGSCMRQAYFARTGQKKVPSSSPSTNAYFLEGNFKHLKWQFALWKAHRAGYLELVGVEVRVRSPSGDFVGTIDALVRIDGVLYLVDFKGVNVIDFQRFVRDGAKFEYVLQLIGYGIIVNGSLDTEYVVKHCLSVQESKAGPISGGNPIALHEELLKVDDYKREVRARLEQLRRHEKDSEIPDPACVSTRHRQFQECPFAWFCLAEVRAIQREREHKARIAEPTAGKPSVARGRR